jgi:ubiquinone biosynthesis accessory factor UbiJ
LSTPPPALPPLYLAPINRLLRQNSWALQRLAPFAGKTLRVDSFPFTLLLGVGADGVAVAAPPGQAPDVTVRLTPGILLRLAARDATVWNDIAVDGDAPFAAALSGIARNLRWDVEEDLSRMFGDIAAHRIVQTGRKLDLWARQGADNLARSFTEYWTEEQPLLARRADVDEFNRAVDTLRDDVARLEKRIDRREALSVKREA